MAGSIREPDTSQRPVPHRRRRRKVRRRKTVNEGAMIRIVSLLLLAAIMAFLIFHMK